MWTEPDEEIEFQLPHGELIALLRANRFEVENLFELYSRPDAVDHEYYGSNVEWSKKWPAEEVWRARKTA